MAYQLMHVARRAMARATGTGWSLRRLRERFLRDGARLIISARRMTLTRRHEQFVCRNLKAREQRQRQSSSFRLFIALPLHRHDRWYEKC